MNDETSARFEDASVHRPAPLGVGSDRALGPKGRMAVVLSLAASYTVFLSTMSIVAHRGLKTQMDDLGQADQALWAAAQGDLTMTISNDLDGHIRSSLGVHANLIYWLLAPLYIVWPEPELLLVITSVACGLAGVGLFLFARQRLGDSSWTLAPPIAFWMSPIVHDANLYDFHIVTVVAALLIWMVWAFDAGRFRLGWVLLGLALLCKEDVPLIVAMFGLYRLLTGFRREGLVILLVSVTYFLAITEVVVPLFNEGRGLEKVEGNDKRFAWLGSDPVEILWSILRRPGDVFRHISRPDHLRIPVYLALSGALAGVRAWRMLLLLVPPLATGLLTESAGMTRVTGTYYWITSETVIVLACILAAERHFKTVPGRFPWPLASLMSASCVFSFLLSPLPHGIWATWANYALPPERHTLAAMQELIPDQAALCVQNNLGPHLGHRPDVAAFPRRLSTAEYALIHLRYVGGPSSGLSIRTTRTLFHMEPEELFQRVRDLILSPQWGLLAAKDGFYLFGWGLPARVGREQALRMLDVDVQHFRQTFGRALRFRSSWARFLVSTLSWKQLLESRGQYKLLSNN